MITWKKELQLTKIKQILLQNINANFGTNHKYDYCQMFKEQLWIHTLIKAFKNFYKLFIIY